MRARVSVVIVTRGRASVLPGCLESIARQAPAPDQIVVVAGDEESFPDPLHRRYERLPLTVVRCVEANISRARNIGLEHATGDLVLFIDDDAIARPGWVAGYLDAFGRDASSWVAGGTVFDAREDPPGREFAFGLIHPSGRQIVVRDPERDGVPRGYLASVKGCNFALCLGRMPEGLRFDPFFAFAYDETDLVMRVHRAGGGVVAAPGAVVEHLHAPGAYRGRGKLDRDWRREFASHRRFVDKHCRGSMRWHGRFVLMRRLVAHAARAFWSVVRGERAPREGWRCVAGAISGLRTARRSRGSV